MTVERFVLDTNVLISAALTPAGRPRAILDAIRDGHGVLLFSDETLGELRTRFCSASTTFAGRVASYEDVTRLPQEDRTDGLRLGAAELPDVEVMLSPCRPGIGGRLRGAAVKAVSPAERGQSEAMRLDGGEHRRRLA